MTKRWAAFEPKRVKPLYGAKKPLPIIERPLAIDPDAPDSPTRRYIQTLANERASDKRLGAEGVQ